MKTLFDSEWAKTHCTRCDRPLRLDDGKCPFCDGIRPAMQKGEHAREKAYDAADNDWRREALSAVQKLAVTRQTFASFDLWQVIDKPREPRAAGGVFTRARSRGWIEDSGEVVRNPERHGVKVTLWRSKIYAGQL